MSLEPSFRWWMLIGPAVHSTPPYLSIDRFDAFIDGFRSALPPSDRPGDDGFFLWLRDETDAFPSNGWASELLQRSGGNHEAAIQLLLGFLHEFLLLKRPEWFIRFNMEPRQSGFSNGAGTPASLDVRKAEHVAAVTGLPPIPGPAIRISGTEVSDACTQLLGLPKEAASWWNGRGRRVALIIPQGRPDLKVDALSSVRGSRSPPSDFLQLAASQLDRMGVHRFDACVVDVEQDRASVLAHGNGGAVLIRDRHMRGIAGEGDGLTQWTTERGDRVLLISAPLLKRASENGLGKLPPNLATGEPLAWSQSTNTSERRIAVAIEWEQAAVPKPAT